MLKNFSSKIVVFTMKLLEIWCIQRSSLTPVRRNSRVIKRNSFFMPRIPGINRLEHVTGTVASITTYTCLIILKMFNKNWTNSREHNLVSSFSSFSWFIHIFIYIVMNTRSDSRTKKICNKNHFSFKQNNQNKAEIENGKVAKLKIKFWFYPVKNQNS